MGRFDGKETRELVGAYFPLNIKDARDYYFGL